VIFLDTSAILAAANPVDMRGPDAAAAFLQLSEDGVQLLTHNYVIHEAATLIQRRLGLEPALRFLRQVDAFRTHWIDVSDHDEAVALLRERSRRGLSLTDCASFVIMRRYGITEALAFDRDFEVEGFTVYRVSRDDV